MLKTNDLGVTQKKFPSLKYRNFENKFICIAKTKG